MTRQHASNLPERGITPAYPSADMHFDNQWRSPLRFLWFCAGANRQYLERPECAVDRNKYAGIGATVLLTSVFAMASGSYACYFIFHSLILGALVGLLWAGVVFNVDRFVVQSVWKSREQTFTWPSVVLRLILAGLVATVISAPLELKILQPEIEAQMARDLERRQTQQDSALLSDPTLVTLNEQLHRLQGEDANKAAIREDAFKTAMGEARGTGPTRQVGKGPVYGEMKDHWHQLEEEYRQTITHNEPRIQDLQRRIQERQDDLKRGASGVTAVDQTNNGLLRRLLALHELQGDPETGNAATVTTAVVFLLFLMIETMPLVSKLLTGFGPYNAAQEDASAAGILKLDQEHLLEETYIKESTIHKVSAIKQVENAKSEALEGVLASLKQSPEYQALTADMAFAFICQIRREFSLIQGVDTDVMCDRPNPYRSSQNESTSKRDGADEMYSGNRYAD
jgi:hypothetical protein